MQSSWPELPHAVPRWDGTRLLFEVDDGGNRLSCSISREALERAGGGGHTARRWQLLEAFERLRPRIERIALAKARVAPAESIGMMTTISTDELDDLPPSSA
jgi:hypothetical protein